MYTRDEIILSCTLIGEARGEPIEGIVGVASVVRNRFQLKWHGETSYADICLAKKQFSCWLPSDPNYGIITSIQDAMEFASIPKDIAYRQCIVVAKAIIDWDFRDNTRGATNYITTDLFNSLSCPSWAKRLKVVANVGHHIFMV